jgi:hypothetical protein
MKCSLSQSYTSLFLKIPISFYQYSDELFNNNVTFFFICKEKSLQPNEVFQENNIKESIT